MRALAFQNYIHSKSKLEGSAKRLGIGREGRVVDVECPHCHRLFKRWSSTVLSTTYCEDCLLMDPPAT
jgi:hypothetical protein